MEVEVYFIHAGQRLIDNKPHCAYYIIATLEQNNGRSAEGLRKFIVVHRMWPASVGQIFKATLVDESQVKFSAKAVPVAVWKNKEDRANWKLQEAPVVALKGVKSEAKTNELAEILKPLRESYMQASWQQRTAMLAEVIRIITR